MLRLDIPIRQAPATVGPLWEGTHLVGRARPARHAGSVDVFLEAFERAEPGDVLVVDNSGRDDEACVGDLVTLEAQHAGLAGIVIWGLHRDSRERAASACPCSAKAPFRQARSVLTPRSVTRSPPHGSDRMSSRIRTSCSATMTGCCSCPSTEPQTSLSCAATIRDTERHQAARVNLGTSLRDQTRFADFLIAREQNGTTFRQHLRSTGGAIEE